MAEKKFESSFARLEKIVERLESGELELDEALKLYEEGTKLVKTCAGKLTEAEKKIKKLSRGENGKLTAEETDAFTDPNGDAEEK